MNLCLLQDTMQQTRREQFEHGNAARRKENGQPEDEFPRTNPKRRERNQTIPDSRQLH